jgi:hypothetical protein
MVMIPAGLEDLRMTALARTSSIVNDRPVLLSESAPYINKSANV